jgi:hypothetical protein
VDWVQVANAVAQALGESRETAEQVLRDLFREYPVVMPADWTGVEQILNTVPIVEYGKIGQLLAELKKLAGEKGDAEDPRSIFQDPDLGSRYAPAAQGPDTAQAAGVPVAEGSAIYRDAGQPQQEDHEAWNSFLAQHGPRWDGTEESWQPFRDWFLYYADQSQVGESARGFIAYAESGDKVNVDTLMADVPGFAAAVLGFVAEHVGKKSFDSEWQDISTDSNEKDTAGRVIQQSYDWYYAMHHWRYRVKGNSENPDGSGNLRYTVEVFKPYIFGAPRGDIRIPGTQFRIPQDQIAHLNTVGEARDFDIKGQAEFVYIVTETMTRGKTGSGK